MCFYTLIFFCCFVITSGRHFDGGTINWAPIDPYDNSSSVDITITQSYSWSYPVITCAANVPISTSGRSSQNANLTCVVDCSTDGGYSTQPINILTDCTSASSSLGMMTSQRSHNISLTAGAHFYLANVGSAWVALDDPAQSGLEWSIVTFIDLRMRPDGFINTPPVASVVSPQYAIVNRTIQINIPVSDVNAGDDVRCRWSTYTAGSRRRKRSVKEDHTNHQYADRLYKKRAQDEEYIHSRKKRLIGMGTLPTMAPCPSGCYTNFQCTWPVCQGTTCSGSTCTDSTCCDDAPSTTTTSTTTTITTTTTAATTTSITTTVTTTSRTTTSTSATTTSITTTVTTTSRTTTSTSPTTTSITTTVTTTATDTTSTTAVETPGTLKSTSSYPHRQALDECGGICYPNTVPNTTTLSNCTITFTGSKAGTWYAVALQVEDFINDTSTTPMSSVPVQFLIYVLPIPTCGKAPIILPLNGCLEVQVGVSISFNIYAMNLCNWTIANLTDMIISSGINGMSASNLTSSTVNSSLYYLKFIWTPQANQIGPQQLCIIAFTSELVESVQYCVIFTVKTSSDLCVITTTTSTSTTTKTTTSTSTTTTTTSTTTTSETTTTTTMTTSTSTTSTSTSTTTSSTTTSSTSSTSTTSSTSSTTGTSTSSTTSTTSTSSSSTSSTSSTTTTSTTTSSSTSVTTTTSTSSTATTATTTTVTTATTSTAAKAKAPKNSTNWPLILGLSLLALLLALCCSCCCLYWFLWSPAARRRRQKKEEANVDQTPFVSRNIVSAFRKKPAATRIYELPMSDMDRLADSTRSTNDRMTNNSPSDMWISLSEAATAITDGEESKVSSAVSVKKIRRTNIATANNTEKHSETARNDVKSADDRANIGNIPPIQRSAVTVLRINKVSNIDDTDKKDSNTTRQDVFSATLTTPSKTFQTNVINIPRNETAKTNWNATRPGALSGTSTITRKASQINVTKIPRNKSTANQRRRASSVDNVSPFHLEKSLIEMRPMTDRLQRSALGTDGKTNTAKGIIVTKLPRNHSNSHLITLKSA